MSYDVSFICIVLLMHEDNQYLQHVFSQKIVGCFFFLFFFFIETLIWIISLYHVWQLHWSMCSTCSVITQYLLDYTKLLCSPIFNQQWLAKKFNRSPLFRVWSILNSLRFWKPTNVSQCTRALLANHGGCWRPLISHCFQTLRQPRSLSCCCRCLCKDIPKQYWF
jgi:hypothetical protein